METKSELVQLPGFRFHPTEEDLLNFYLRNAVHRNKPDVDIITVLNLYLYDPWDLPAMAKMGEREWYFYVPRNHKQGNSCRPNRTTNRGFWKATGSDRQIRSTSDPKRLLGLKKTLVFYEGRAPQGTRTDWVMNEYRLTSATKEDVVLCKVYRKATSKKALEKRAAEMDEKKRVQLEVVVPERSLNWLAWDGQQLRSPWMEYWSPYADLFCF